MCMKFTNTYEHKIRQVGNYILVDSKVGRLEL